MTTNNPLIHQYNKIIQRYESYYNLIGKKRTRKKNQPGFSRKRLLYFLQLLDAPQKKLKFIHIGGTSGKGSTVEMVHSILKHSQYTVGSYSSPHLCEFTDRIKVNNKLISIEEFLFIDKKISEALNRYLTHTKFEMLSYGEIAFAIALYYFVQKKCDYAIIEVGCGGKTDLTNIIPPPIATAITNIGHDHLDLFGPTLLDLAKEKSGIIKDKTNFFTSEKNQRFLTLFKHKCKKRKAFYHKPILLPKINKKTKKFSFFSFKKKEFVIPSLSSSQIENALLALQITTLLKIPYEMQYKGLKNITIPLRFEYIQKKPIIVLDSAHNKEKLTSTFNQYRNMVESMNHGKKILLFAISKKENLKEIIDTIPDKFDKIILTRHNNTFKKSHNVYELYKLVKKTFKKTDVSFSISYTDAFESIQNDLTKNDVCLVTGSVYLAGEIRKIFIPSEYILNNRTLKKR